MNKFKIMAIVLLVLLIALFSWSVVLTVNNNKQEKTYNTLIKKDNKTKKSLKD